MKKKLVRDNEVLNMAEIEFEEYWEKARSKDVLLEIELTNTTLARIGSYNARPYSSSLDLYELPRTTQIKGLWRWWARVILNTVLWNKGYEADYLFLDNIIGNFLGSQENASLYKINVIVHPKNYLRIEYSLDSFLKKFKNIHFNKRGRNVIRKKLNEIDLVSKDGKIRIRIGELSKIPRIKLILMPRKNEDRDSFLKRVYEELVLYPKNSLNIKIILLKNSSNYEKYFDVALSSLLLSLLFGGIGAITSRGFGALKVSKFNPNNLIKDHISKDIANIHSAYDSKKAFEDKISEILLYAENCFEKIKIYYEKINKRTSSLPIVPVLSLKDNLFKFCIEKVRNIGKYNEDIQVLQKIGKATLKIYWKKYPRECGYKYDTWILGLPRAQRGTGYYYSNNQKRGKKPIEGRHVSAIRFTPLLLKDRYYVLVYGFVTRDWLYYKDLKLKHFGKYHMNGKDIKKNPLVAFNEAFDKVCKIISG